MSVTRRLISGSAVSWLQIAVNLLSQLLLIPVYLSFWSISAYGVWLALQSLISILFTLDLGHQNFLGYEFLKLGQDQKKSTNQVLWSGVAVGALVGFLQLAVVAFFIWTNLIQGLLTDNTSAHPADVSAGGIILLLQSITWYITSCMGGILIRVLTAYDYYSRLAWWTLLISVSTSVAPAIAVVLGHDLLTAGIVLCVTTCVVNLFCYLDMFSLLKKLGLLKPNVSISLGWKNFKRSMILSGQILLENARIGGVRIILAPLAGAQMLVNFSTIRTGANFALQGLRSITNPLMPELMKFLNKRDQDRCETVFATIWVVLIAVLAPAVIVLQSISEPLFMLWTKGQITFDTGLFALLSLSVLVYALAQPAMSIATGNNLLRTQLVQSLIAVVIVVGGIFFLVPIYGIKGAGIALLAAEVATCIGYRLAAKSWLRANGLTWPVKSYALAEGSIYITAAAMVGMVLLPGSKFLFMLAGLFLLALNIIQYWKTLPEFARDKAKKMAGVFPLVRHFIIK